MYKTKRIAIILYNLFLMGLALFLIYLVKKDIITFFKSTIKFQNTRHFIGFTIASIFLTSPLLILNNLFVNIVNFRGIQKKEKQTQLEDILLTDKKPAKFNRFLLFNSLYLISSIVILVFSCFILYTFGEQQIYSRRLDSEDIFVLSVASISSIMSCLMIFDAVAIYKARR